MATLLLALSKRSKDHSKYGIIRLYIPHHKNKTPYVKKCTLTESSPVAGSMTLGTGASGVPWKSQVMFGVGAASG